MHTLTQYMILIVLAIIIIPFSGCFIETITDTPPQDPDESELIFHSGFEGTSAVLTTNNDQIDDIEGIDTTLPNPNDWVLDFDQHNNIGSFRIYYEGGDESQRWARVVADPENPENQALSFRLAEANVDWLSKGRVQADVYGNNGLFEIYQKVRIYLDPDFAELRNYPERIWFLNLLTIWNNRSWDNTPFPFKISLHLEKPEEGMGEDLFFNIQGRIIDDIPAAYEDEFVWQETNEAVEVPFGEWFMMEMYFKEGDETEGRFYLAITPEGGEKEVVFDIHNFTHHPYDPDPDGLTDFNPMKLYTSHDIIEFMQSNDKVLQIYWDDYELWKNRQPDSTGTN